MSRDAALLLLHALPLDGGMWAEQMDLLPGATLAPDLYRLGDGVADWAAALLRSIETEHLIVVGCSVGGSCALEMAAAAPDRIAALVLVGTKAGHRPDPALERSVLELIEERGLEAAWDAVWAPMLSSSAEARVAADARHIALRQSPADVSRGVAAFHARRSRAELLAEVDCPVIFVSGSEDRAPGPAASAAQAKLAWRGRVEVIPRCGHYVPLERPDELNDLLREVIALRGCSAPD